MKPRTDRGSLIQCWHRVDYFFSSLRAVIKVFAPGVSLRSLSAKTCFSELEAFSARFLICVTALRRLRRRRNSRCRSLEAMSGIAL